LRNAHASLSGSPVQAEVSPKSALSSTSPPSSNLPSSTSASSGLSSSSLLSFENLLREIFQQENEMSLTQLSPLPTYTTIPQSLSPMMKHEKTIIGSANEKEHPISMFNLPLTITNSQTDFSEMLESQNWPWTAFGPLPGSESSQTTDYFQSMNDDSQPMHGGVEKATQFSQLSDGNSGHQKTCSKKEISLCKGEHIKADRIQRYNE
jgi:hypothetical protein